MEPVSHFSHLNFTDLSAIGADAAIMSVFPMDKWFAHLFKKAPFKSHKIDIVGGLHTLLHELQLKDLTQVLFPYDNVCAMGDMNR